MKEMGFVVGGDDHDYGDPELNALAKMQQDDDDDMDDDALLAMLAAEDGGAPAKPAGPSPQQKYTQMAQQAE